MCFSILLIGIEYMMFSDEGGRFFFSISFWNFFV